jgi:hypothetical protein
MSTFRSKVRPVFFAHANLTMELKLNQKISLPRGRGSDKIAHMHIFDYAVLSFLYKCVHCMRKMFNNLVIFQTGYSRLNVC